MVVNWVRVCLRREERQVSGGTRRRPGSKDRWFVAASMLAVYMGRWGVSVGVRVVGGYELALHWAYGGDGGRHGESVGR